MLSNSAFIHLRGSSNKLRKVIGSDAVVWSHTHSKMERINENKTIEYYNSGDWVENKECFGI